MFRDRVDGYQIRKHSRRRAMRLRTLSVSKRQDDNEKKRLLLNKDAATSHRHRKSL
jgi:hypothetical protein